MQRHPVDPIAQAHRNWSEAGWGDVADAMAAVTSIMRVHQLLLARIEGVLKPFGVSFARYEMLRLLAFTQERALTMGRARSLLQVHPASVSGIVDRLSADGFVRRTAHPGDGRSVVVELTDTGADLVDRATAALNAQVFADPGCEPTDLVDLTRILAAFRRSSGDTVDDPGGG